MGNTFLFRGSRSDTPPFYTLEPSHRMTKRPIEEEDSTSRPANTWLQERNSDVDYLENVYTKMFGSPRRFHKIRPRRTEDERNKYLSEMESLGIRCDFHSLEYKINNARGTVFSNILLSSYLKELTGSMKRANLDISFSLYTPCLIEMLPLFKTKPDGHDYLFRMLKQWIFQCGILNNGTSEITRSGFLLSFLGIESNKENEGHEMLVIAEKLRGSDQITCFCVDNLDSEEYDEGPEEFNISHWIRKGLGALNNENIVVYDYHNKLPGMLQHDYSCMASARRAVIYAAILKNFTDSAIWDEGNNWELFNYHFKNYMKQMHRMLQWFEDRKEFWNEKHWTLWPSDEFVRYKKIRSKGDNLLVQLRPEIAYVNIKKGDDEVVKMWYCGKGTEVFVEGREAGSCITQSEFLW